MLGRALPVALACLVALAGCTVGPSERPPVAVRGQSAPAPPGSPAPTVSPPPALPAPEPQNATIPFVDCTEDALATAEVPIPPGRALRVECGEMAVPVDPRQPALGRTLIGVLRVGLADAPRDRPPLVVVGDSHGEATALHALNRAAQVPAELLEEYTLVGIDRRGAGLDRLDCAPGDARAALVDADPAGLPTSQLDTLLEQARAVVQECYLVLSGALGAVRTAGTAADIDQLRVGLGVSRISGIGVGDGATALGTWARISPRAVGRIVLDGPTDPARTEPELSEARAGAAEAAFDAFATACSAAPSGCALGPDPRAGVQALLDDLRARPLVADDGRRLTAGATVTAVLAVLGDPRRWPELTAALAGARGGDPDGLLAVLDPVLGPAARFDTGLAITCNDTSRRLSPPEVAGLIETWRADHPLFGPTFAQRLLACAPWPAPAPLPDLGTATGSPPILVIGTAAGPRATLDGSRRAAESLAGGRFVSWLGAGTGAYPRTPCVTALVDRMLLDGVVPTPEALCPP